MYIYIYIYIWLILVGTGPAPWGENEMVFFADGVCWDMYVQIDVYQSSNLAYGLF